MKTKKRKSFLMLLLYVNIVMYMGGEICSDVQPRASSHNAFIQANSSYGQLIRKYAQGQGLDWRFVASIIQTESRFRPGAVSPVGAVGLMQVLPWVAEAEGITNIHDPEQNIRFGVKHYMRYFKTLQGETLEDTLKLNLAAYNAGSSHVRDARLLARYFGLNPNKWSTIARMLPLLEDKDFQPFVKHGICQGNSVVSYVNKVFHTYEMYRQKVPDYPVQIAEL